MSEQESEAPSSQDPENNRLEAPSEPSTPDAQPTAAPAAATADDGPGFEFVAAMKSDATLPKIPVIFLTSMEDGDGRGKELGAVGYLTKPVRADRLLELVAQHVPGGAIPIG